LAIYHKKVHNLVNIILKNGSSNMMVKRKKEPFKKGLKYLCNYLYLTFVNSLIILYFTFMLKLILDFIICCL
jgi:hypothetical protein